MPCRTDYMEPTVQERQQQQAAALLVFAKGKLGDTVPHSLKVAAEQNDGGGRALGERHVEQLCSLIRAMTEQELNDIVYNGRDPMSRKLANWWDEHQVEDEKRIEIEKGRLKTARGAKNFFDRNQGREFGVVVTEFAKFAEFWIDDEDSVHWFELEDGVLIVSRMNGVEVWQGSKL